MSMLIADSGSSITIGGKTVLVTSEEIQELLRHMQRTTSLLAQTCFNTSSSSAPPSASFSAPPSASHSSSSAPPSASSSAPPSASFSAPPSASHSSSSAPPSTSFSVLSPHQSSTSLPPSPYLASSSSATPSLLPSVWTSYERQLDPQPNIQANLARLFGPYRVSSGGWKGSRKRKREVPWTHTFVCLPEPGAEAVPNPQEANFFGECGIGRKTITFNNNMGDHEHLSDVLYTTFPPLRGAGGYVLAKSDRSKKLNGIPIPPSGYSIEYLRRHIDIKRAPLYIIPLQRSLTLHLPVVEVPTVMETCLMCYKDIPLCDLARHLTSCTKSDECEEMTSHHSEDSSNDDEDLALAIYESLQPSMPVEVTAEEQPDVISLLRQLRSQLHVGVPPPSNSVNIMRDSVLESGFRAFGRQRFSPAHRLNVVFIDSDGITEGAVDDGGPTREFLRLLVLAVKNSIYFSGQEYRKNLSLVSRVDQKHNLAEEAARAYVEGRTQKALQQLVDGLKTLGVADAIEKDPDVLKPLFVGGPKALEVQDLLDLFSPCFSPPGSNRRRQENQALMFWKDWLIEVDEGTRPVTLEQMLIFASGIDCIPPLGFPNHPTIEFLHDSNGNRRIFPEANTCEVILRLPLHPSYSIFMEYMESGILQSPTFGLI
ncbi:hypothetical protein ABVT39_018006 [Epinephelus coioides]